MARMQGGELPLPWLLESALGSKGGAETAFMCAAPDEIESRKHNSNPNLIQRAKPANEDLGQTWAAFDMEMSRCDGIAFSTLTAGGAGRPRESSQRPSSTPPEVRVTVRVRHTTLSGRGERQGAKAVGRACAHGGRGIG